jgi:hypothetical protein
VVHTKGHSDTAARYAIAKAEDWTSLPTHFKRSGYYTAGHGKIFHGNGLVWPAGLDGFDGGDPMSGS